MKRTIERPKKIRTGYPRKESVKRAKRSKVKEAYIQPYKI